MNQVDDGQKSLIALDLMRGLAAFIVLTSHLRGDYFVPYGELPAAQHGIATMAFFAATRVGVFRCDGVFCAEWFSGRRAGHFPCSQR